MEVLKALFFKKLLIKQIQKDEKRERKERKRLKINKS